MVGQCEIRGEIVQGGGTHIIKICKKLTKLENNYRFMGVAEKGMGKSHVPSVLCF